MNQVDRRDQWWQTICSESCVSGRLFCSNRHTQTLSFNTHKQFALEIEWNLKRAEIWWAQTTKVFMVYYFLLLFWVFFFFACANTRTYLKETRKLVRTFEKSKEANDRKSFIYLSQRVEFGSKLYAGFRIIIFAFKWIRRGVLRERLTNIFGPFHPFWFQLFPFRCWLLCLSISSFVHWFRRFSVCLFAECTRGRIKCILHRRTDQTRTGSHDLGSNVKGITEPGNDIWDHKTFFQANFLKHANHLARVCLPYVEWSSFVIISIEWQ